MSKNIVKYGNDFNLLPMPQLKALQMDIFMAVLSLVREKKENTPFLKRFFNPELRELVIPQKTFIDLCRLQDSNMPYTDIFHLIDNTLEKLVKTTIKYQKDEKTIYNFVCFEIGAIIASDIHITFTKTFYDMIINYKYGFTAFELGEFVSLSSKYTKTLYRLLKQYRTTGKFIIKLPDFLEIMGIPSSYRMRDIDKQILQPAIKELAEPTLFAPEQIPFINLQYEKIKGKGRGRGGVVVALHFTFKPQSVIENNEVKPTKLTAKTFNLGKWIGTKWHHSDIGDFEIVSGDVAVPTAPVRLDYKLLENGNYGEIKGKNLDELIKKLAELTPYAH